VLVVQGPTAKVHEAAQAGVRDTMRLVKHLGPHLCFGN
jgi:hypothetical protein